MVIAGGDGVIVHVNNQAERLFGYSASEMIGGTIEMLMPQRFASAHVAHRSAYVESPRVRPMGQGLDLFGLRKDGSEFPVEISLSPLHTPQGDFVTAAIRDISERKQAESALRAQTLSRPIVRRIVRALVDQLSVPSQVVSELGRSLARDVPQESVMAYVQAFNDMGLGRLELNRHDGQTYTFRARDVLEARPGATLPTCHLALGFLEGAVGALHDANGLGTEMRCQSLGHEFCVFVVKPRGVGA